MSKWINSPCTGLALGLAVALTSAAQAQDDKPAATNAVARDADARHHHLVVSPHENDQRIARWLLVDNKGEIELAKLAQQRTSNDAVRQFAKRLVDDHQKCVDELQACIQSQAPETSDAAPTGTDGTQNRRTKKSNYVPSQSSRTATLEKDDGASRGGQLVYRAVDFLTVKESVCKEVCSEIKTELEKMNGAEFDRTFVGMQVCGHHAMLANLKALRGYATKDFAAAIDRGVIKTKEHLAAAKELCKSLHDGASTANR